MTEAIALDAFAVLSDRLLDMRAYLLGRMAAEGAEPAFLTLMAGVQATLVAIDESPSGIFGVQHAREGDTPSPRRGGDPRAAERRRRDEVLRALARLNDNAASAEQQARDLADRLARFHPLPVETSPERQLMRQVVDGGLPVPSAERIRKILRSGQAKKSIG